MYMKSVLAYTEVGGEHYSNRTGYRYSKGEGKCTEKGGRVLLKKIVNHMNVIKL